MKHHRTILSATLAFATTVLLQAMPNATTDAYAADGQQTEREATRRWHYELRSLRNFLNNAEHVSRSWHRKKRPSRRELIELDPPLPTTSPGKVEIEMLYTYLADLPDGLRSKLKTVHGGHGAQAWPHEWNERA